MTTRRARQKSVLKMIIALVIFVASSSSSIHGCHAFVSNQQRILSHGVGTTHITYPFTSVHVQPGSIRTRIFSNNDNNDNNNKPDNNNSQPLSERVLLFLFSAIFIAIVTDNLLAILNDPTKSFDVDMFLSLKGIMDIHQNSPSMGEDTIVALPMLSPAEQIVGAFFGPPH